MLKRSIIDNQYGISLMYDVVLFIIMVSLAGVILLPISQRTIIRESSIDKHREDVVDNTLHTFLVSRPDLFQYRFCAGLIDDVAESIGINTSSEGLYASITEWTLAHEQRHKTYAALLAENLGCQFLLPFSFFGMNRLNIFTTDYDRQLHSETEQFFSSFLGDKYHYNFTTWWHPIKGISFGGSFSVGEHPPAKDCYVAQHRIIMPYTPIFSIGNQTIILTKHWFRHRLFTNTSMFGRSSIPPVENMMRIFENYTNRQPPYHHREAASRAIQENLSILVYGFLIEGITDETNTLVFPGVVNTAFMYGFKNVKDITSQFFDSALDESFGGIFRTLDHVFGTLNSSINNPISNMLLAQLNRTLNGLLNESFSSLSDAFDACEALVKERITSLLKGIIDGLIESFVNSVFDVVETLIDFSEMLLDWLFDRISLNSAEAVLTIWVVRE